VRDDATWRLAWLYYRSGDFSSAFASFGNLAGRSGDNSWRTAALYWQARTAEKSGDLETAKRLHRQIVNGGEESYYQALSARAGPFSMPIEDSKISIPSAGISGPARNSEFSFHLVRARTCGDVA
jgi:hypothetical protein